MYIMYVCMYVGRWVCMEEHYPTGQARLVTTSDKAYFTYASEVNVIQE
jgi:hypothetical protein